MRFTYSLSAALVAASASFALAPAASANTQQTTLSVVKTVAEQVTIPGAPLHYTITVRNTGNVTAGQVYVDDYIFPNMFVTQLDSRCGLVLYPNGSTGVRCFLDDIAPGQSVTKNLVFRTGGNYECNNGAMARNSAGAWGNNTASTVTTPTITTPVLCGGYSSSSSSSSSVSSYYTCSEMPWLCSSSSSSSANSSEPRTTLSIEKTVNESQTTPGADLHYRIAVRNTGSAPAYDVTVEDYVHPGMIAEDVGSMCTKIGSTLVRCVIGTLQPGQTATGEMRFRTESSYACDNGSVARNAAAASARNADGVTSALVVTAVNCGGTNNDHGLRVRKEALRREALPGDVLEYRITVENNTDRDLHDVIVTDQFDDRDLQVFDDGDADEEDDGELTWRIGTLRAGDDEVIRYRLRLRPSVRPGDRIRNDVSVRASGGYDDDDSASISVIGSLPQTGFNLTAISHLSPVNDAGESSPLAAILTLAMAGVGIGGFLGRRYFL